MFQKIIKFLSFFMILATSLFNPLLVQAATDIDYNNILSDAEASDYDSMTQVEIRDFLRSKNSYLANYWYYGDNPSPTELGIDASDPNRSITPANEVPDFPKQRSATEIIYNAAYEFKINPKFLLVMLQKEQGLIEKSEPTERNLAYAMGYYCFDGQYCNPKWKGFGKQVRSTAEQFRYYIDNIHKYDHQPGKSSCVDDPTPYLPCTTRGTEIKPANAITAAMYVYTPHIHGNTLFATIWQRYGFDNGALVDNNTDTDDVVDTFAGIFPHGALVKTADDETVYLIYGNQKLPFGDTTALVSRFDPGKVLTVDSVELGKFFTGAPIQFPNYAILQAPSGQKYLVDGLEKRAIVSDDVYRTLGFNPEEVIDVTDVELAQILDGSPLGSDNQSPFEYLYKDSNTGGVYYVKDGEKAPIVDPMVIKINYPNMEIVSVTESTLGKYRKISAVKIKDGNLVKLVDDPRVYVISNGQRRAIEDEATFLGLGYSWDDIYEVNDRVMKLHPIGRPLKL